MGNLEHASPEVQARYHALAASMLDPVAEYRIIEERVTGNNNGRCARCLTENAAPTVWWVDDSHGYPFAGPFDTRQCASDWLVEFRDLCARRRAQVVYETQRSPIAGPALSMTGAEWLARHQKGAA